MGRGYFFPIKPFLPESQSILAGNSDDANDMANIQILIAEDEKHTRLALRLVLRQAGFNVLETSNGKEAFQKITNHPIATCPINLIITDINMPSLDGLGLIDKLRELEITIPVMVITGYGDNNLIQRLQERDCAAYIDKPFIPEEVISQVKTVLHRRNPHALV